MAGYSIEDVPHVELSDAERSSLVSKDEAQVALMAEAVVQVNERDEVLGPLSKLEAHRGPGAFHRAFSLLLFNSKGEMLLQRRSMDKVTFPGVWANA
ncbi:MAG: hypothetical protein ACO3L7_05365 [Poseidonia sp.]